MQTNPAVEQSKVIR